SASKSHWGGLRIGWLRASHDLAHRFVSARTRGDLGTAVLEQLVLTELLDAGDAALAARRAEIRAQRDTLATAVREQLGWSFRLPAGGLSLWCELPDSISTRLAVSAPAHGVRLAPGASFGAHGGLERWLRLPYALPAPVLTDGVARLVHAVGSLTGAQVAETG